MFDAVKSSTTHTTAVACDHAIQKPVGIMRTRSHVSIGAVVAHELEKKGMKVRRQLALPVVYDGLEFKEAYRLDLLVENSVIVELKTTEQIHPVHRAQLLTYLKLSGRRLGLLITFNTRYIKQGISRVIL